jgi:Arc/MetJ family transcription regulator
MVYMARTNIDIDEGLLTEAMRRYGLHSKRAAVDLALRRLVGESMTRDKALAMEGAGWEGDLDEIRRDRRLARMWDRVSAHATFDYQEVRTTACCSWSYWSNGATTAKYPSSFNWVWTTTNPWKHGYND